MSSGGGRRVASLATMCWSCRKRVSVAAGVRQTMRTPTYWALRCTSLPAHGTGRCVAQVWGSLARWPSQHHTAHTSYNCLWWWASVVPACQAYQRPVLDLCCTTIIPLGQLPLSSTPASVCGHEDTGVGVGGEVGGTSLHNEQTPLTKATPQLRQFPHTHTNRRQHVRTNARANPVSARARGGLKTFSGSHGTSTTTSCRWK